MLILLAIFIAGIIILPRLPQLSVKRPITISMVFLGILIIGTIALTRLPIELLPNFSFGDISIFVDIRGGIPPEEVEEQVSKPIEDSVSTVSHLRSIISISEEGRSRVVMRFEPGINMDYALLEVREKFSRIKNQLPKQIEKPVIAKFEQQDVPILIIAATGLGYTPEMLRRIVDDEIKDRILRVNGVANVDIGGGRERKILVEVDQRKLQAYRLPIGKVINALNYSNVDLLLGGYDKGKNKYLIRVLGGFDDMEDIENVGIMATPSKSIIRVKDVAVVKDSFLEAQSYSRVNVLPVVSLYIQKETEANTVEVIKQVQEVEKKLTTEILDKRIRLIETYNQAGVIEQAIDGVKRTLMWGAFLAILVLWVFLRDIRSTFIIAISIPISVIATFMCMFFLKITLNVMTLSGLAIGVGMLVDNSVVVLENIHRLREKAIKGTKVVIQGAQEMILAIIAATITTVVVFLPIVFVSKDIRILYMGLALTVAFSLISSLFVSLSIVPMLSAHLPLLQWRLFRRKETPVKPAKAMSKKFQKPLIDRLRMRYRRTLIGALRSRYLIFAISMVMFVAAIYVLCAVVEKEFVGATEQQDFTIFVELPTGAKLDISDQAVAGMEKILETIPEVKQFSSRIEKWSSKIYVKLVPLAQRARSTNEIIEDLRVRVEDVERKYREAFIYFEEAQEVETNEIILEIFGYNYNTLNEIAISMLTRMQTIPGLVDLKIRWRKGRPEWRLKVNRQKAALYGFSVDDIANVVHAQMRGLRATLFHTDAKQVEVIARLQEKDRRTLDQLRKLTLTKPDGTRIYLEQVVDFEPGLGPSKIWRKNKSRMIQVSANRGRHAFGTAANKITEALKGLKLPKDYYFDFGENYWRMIRNQKEFLALWPPGILWIVIVLIYLVLASLFESYTQPLIIMITVPLAAIGVAVALLVSKKTINIGVLMGSIMLGGIVVNNAIILIDYANRLSKNGYGPFRAIVTSGIARLRPIMMTTCTTLLGLLPMAIDKSEQANLWSPLAITVMGGLISSTILTLFIVPSTYLIFHDIRNRRWRLR
ncbi:MAG: efflux RND transporter permease subunit [Candidatus Omnitrophica bacterium]|nr:efflux RND transporter permease subunit [Candidatus Omnitrophota bacterium]